MSLETLITAYIACALWSSSDTTEEGGEYISLDDHDGELTEEARATMAADCKSFYESDQVQRYLTQAAEQHGYTDEQAGHDFWLTRNGHGAGFWDRGIGAAGTMLTDAAKAYGSADLYIGDDGEIHHG